MLKQTADGNRTLFLKLFTQELVLNSKPKIEEKKKAVETSEITKPIELKKTETIKKEELIPSILKAEIPKPTKTQRGFLKPLTKPIESLKQYPALPTFPSIIKPSKFTIPISSLPEIEGEVNLGKLSIFLMDSAVTEIECPGPEKFVLVRKAGQVNLTKIILTQKEITEIIESFSRQTRIPLISGVFKASIGNLTITAIISEFVGSRFIIYKASPYSLIEQQARQLHQAQLQGRLLYNRRKYTSQFL